MDEPLASPLPQIPLLQGMSLEKGASLMDLGTVGGSSFGSMMWEQGGVLVIATGEMRFPWARGVFRAYGLLLTAVGAGLG